jgi:hypothetical protein
MAVPDGDEEQHGGGDEHCPGHRRRPHGSSQRRRKRCEIVQRQKMLCYNLAFMARRQAGKALTKDWDQQDNQPSGCFSKIKNFEVHMPDGDNYVYI